MQPNNIYYQPPAQNDPLVGVTNVPKKPKKSIFTIIIIVLLILLFLGASAFAVWAFMQRQDYKNNSDKKAAAAVEIANKKLKEELDKQFAEAEKNPNKTYTSPSQDGNISFAYPKTWSSYVVEQNTGAMPLDGFFQPNFVPNITGDLNTYALRMQLLAQDYNSILLQYQSNIKKGTLKSTPYTDQNVKGSAVGVRLDGQLTPTKQGSMIVIPIRDKVLKLWTENSNMQGDFNNVVLKTLTFSP